MNLLNEVNIQLWEIKGSNKRGLAGCFQSLCWILCSSNAAVADAVMAGPWQETSHKGALESHQSSLINTDMKLNGRAWVQWCFLNKEALPCPKGHCRNSVGFMWFTFKFSNPKCHELMFVVPCDSYSFWTLLVIESVICISTKLTAVWFDKLSSIVLVCFYVGKVRVEEYWRVTMMSSYQAWEGLCPDYSWSTSTLSSPTETTSTVQWKVSSCSLSPLIGLTFISWFKLYSHWSFSTLIGLQQVSSHGVELYSHWSLSPLIGLAFISWFQLYSHRSLSTLIGLAFNSWFQL